MGVKKKKNKTPPSRGKGGGGGAIGRAARREKRLFYVPSHARPKRWLNTLIYKLAYYQNFVKYFMGRLYNHKKIESKWQKKWEKGKDFEAREDVGAKKFYSLIEFPYPSGEGLHVGHIRSNTAMDIVARKRRAEGYSVLYPIGYDSFGLPTENFAIKTGIHPAEVTKQNTGKFREQLKSLGYSFDWSRKIDKSNHEYYKWTQWILGV